MSDFDDEDEEQCPGKDECDNEYCDDRQTYFVEVTHTVKFEVRAHDQAEADDVVENVSITADVPDSTLIDGWDGYGETEWDVESEADVQKREAEHRHMIAEMHAEIEREENDARVTAD